MGTSESSGYQARASIHLSLPPEPFGIGIVPAHLRAQPEFDLEAVAVTLITEEQDYELVLSPEATVQAIRQLIAALDLVVHADRPDPLSSTF